MPLKAYQAMDCAHCGHGLQAHNEWGTGCYACLSELEARRELEHALGENAGGRLAHLLDLVEFECDDYDH